MSIIEQRTITNVFLSLSLIIAPLIWICCNRSFNNEIDQLHERCVQTVYSDKSSDFSELLEKDSFCLYSVPKHPTASN